MPQSLTQIWVHIVFSTKNRQAFLKDKNIRDQMHAYLAQICLNHESPAAIIGGVEDHVHILCNQSKNIRMKDLIGELKRHSSKWVKKIDPSLENFYWQTGYGGFSVSTSNVSSVKNYICNQEEHHKTVGFKEEFRAFLKKHEIESDERYVWD